MTVLITLTTAGSLTGPFNLYTNIDGFMTPFETGVAKSVLVAGYTCVLVPTGTTTIQVRSVGACIDSINLPIAGITTTTTTTTVAPITTTVPTTTTTVSPIPQGAAMSIITQGYTTAQLACNNYTNNGGNTGGVGIPGTVYVLGNMVYNANGTPFVGNPALFYVITAYINLTPGLEGTCQIDATGHIISSQPLNCITINIP